MAQAPRLPQRLWQTVLRGAVLMLVCVAPAMGAPVEVCIDGRDGRIARVCYVNATGAAPYGHGVLGATPEWEALRVVGAGAGQSPSAFSEPQHIFEDIAPRLVDLDRDGHDEIVAVQSSFSRGARLAVFEFDADGDIQLLSATPYIGTRNRWLAPIGAADLDGDGHVEIAYIDRPHLAKRLRIWRFRDGMLQHVADASGLTNHRIGEDFITSGIRDCGDGPEMLMADAGWRQVLAVHFDKGSVEYRAIERFRNAEQVANLLACP